MLLIPIVLRREHEQNVALRHIVFSRYLNASENSIEGIERRGLSRACYLA